VWVGVMDDVCWLDGHGKGGESVEVDEAAGLENKDRVAVQTSSEAVTRPTQPYSQLAVGCWGRGSLLLSCSVLRQP